MRLVQLIFSNTPHLARLPRRLTQPDIKRHPGLVEWAWARHGGPHPLSDTLGASPCLTCDGTGGGVGAPRHRAGATPQQGAGRTGPSAGEIVAVVPRTMPQLTLARGETPEGLHVAHHRQARHHPRFGRRNTTAADWMAHLAEGSRGLACPHAFRMQMPSGGVPGVLV
jgi:hypothetical protein